jgi:hypothetical protein
MTGQGTNGDTNPTSRGDAETFTTSDPTLLVARVLFFFFHCGRWSNEVFIDLAMHTDNIVGVFHYATSLPCLIELTFDPGESALAVKVCARRNRGRARRVHRPSYIRS